MIGQETIDRAARILRRETPDGTRIILFGSYARGDARTGSDLDFLVIEPELKSRHGEMVRLRRALEPLRIPVDVLVTSRDTFDRWIQYPNNVLYRASREGVVIGG